MIYSPPTWGQGTWFSLALKKTRKICWDGTRLYSSTSIVQEVQEDDRVDIDLGVRGHQAGGIAQDQVGTGFLCDVVVGLSNV